MPPSQNTKSRNTALVGLVAILAIQIPTTIQAVEPPWLRAMFMVSTLLLVCALAFKVNIPEAMPKPARMPDEDTPQPVTPKETPRSRIPRVGE